MYVLNVCYGGCILLVLRTKTDDVCICGTHEVILTMLDILEISLMLHSSPICCDFVAAHEIHVSLEVYLLYDGLLEKRTFATIRNMKKYSTQSNFYQIPPSCLLSQMFLLLSSLCFVVSWKGWKLYTCILVMYASFDKMIQAL